MCENSFKLAVEVDTRDTVAMLEVGRMFAAIADQRIDARAALVTAPGPGESLAHAGGPDAGAAFNQVEDGERVDAGAAFAHAVPGGEAAPLNGTTAGPGTGIQPGVPGLGGSASPANLTPVNTGAAQPAVELDSTGMPWDQRINTGNKAKTKAGVWKRAGGLTDEFYNGILAELKGVMNGAPAAQASQAAAGPAVAGVPGMIHSYTMPGVGGTFTTAPGEPVPAGGVLVSTSPAPGTQDAAGAAAPPPPAGTTAAPPAPGPAGPGAPEAEEVPADFPAFLQVISKRTVCNPPKLTQPEITTALQVVGAMNGCTLGSLSDLNVRADLIPAAYAELKKVWDAKP